jgi:hypothetical protein
MDCWFDFTQEQHTHHKGAGGGLSSEVEVTHATACQEFEKYKLHTHTYHTL